MATRASTQTESNVYQILGIGVWPGRNFSGESARLREETGYSGQMESLLRANLKIEALGELVHLQVELPEGATTPLKMLLVFQTFANRMVQRSEEAVREAGEEVSCRKGCGACCRQLVPVGQSEALHLAALVAKMPWERQATVRARFARGMAALAEVGIEPGFDQGVDRNAARDLGERYFAAQVACPFLEDESCSIHPDRPLACREYLVTSPAANCRNPGPGRINMVPMAGPLWTSLAKLDGVKDGHVAWQPLIFSLAYAEGEPEPERVAEGPELFSEFVNHFRKRPAPQAPPSA